MNWRVERFLFEVLLPLFAVGTLAGVGFAIYQHATAPDFRLLKAEWQCTAERTETTIVMMDMSGGKGILTPMPVTSTVCDEWKRVK